ncbi:MAG TPA: LLM class F420-dependent oxidoreductase [Jiangellaceae bacterium]
MTDAMKFGLFVPQGWRLDLVGIEPADQWDAMLRVAKHAEDGPWESIWVYDHFHTVPLPTEEATHEAWTLMAAFAAATDRIRLGQMCTCMAYRNPAYLAKVAATVDIVSDGRTEMGIGAGWYEHEWRAYGYGFPSAGDRLGALDEGVDIMRQMWKNGEATLDGKYYQVDGALGYPKPLQDGGIPLWIAGGGEKVTLRIAAKYARPVGHTEPGTFTEYTNFGGGDIDVFRHKSDVLAEHCRDLGTDFDAITRSSNFNVVIAETEADVQDQLAQIEARFAKLLPPDRVERSMAQLRESPATGTPEQVAEAIAAVRDAGMKYAICYIPQAAYDPSSVQVFADKVIPELT